MPDTISRWPQGAWSARGRRWSAYEWIQTLAYESWTPVIDSGSSSQHTYSVPTGTKSKCFMRLKVTIP